jgi:transcriptional regulator with XRE-family HTH domain
MKSELIYEALGKAIRKRREALEMTQGQLAERVGLSRASVTNIELGRQSVLVDQLYEFAEALQVKPAELMPAGSLKPKPRRREPVSPEVADWIERVRKSAE